MSARWHGSGSRGYRDREPAAGIRDRMLPDTEPRGLGVGAIGHLEQADGAGGGLVDRERIETPPPAPVGAVHRIARTLDLRQRGQQFGRDRAGGIGAEQRARIAATSRPAPCRAGGRQGRTARSACGSPDRRGSSARRPRAGSPRLAAIRTTRGTRASFRRAQRARRRQRRRRGRRLLVFLGMRLGKARRQFVGRISLTASWALTSIGCCAGATTRTSRQGFDERADQLGTHGCDRVRDVAFRPRGRRLWVDNRRVSEVTGLAWRNEVLRGELSPARRSESRRPRCTELRGDGSRASRVLHSG